VPRWNPSGYLWNAPDRIDVLVGGPAAPSSPAPVASHEPAAADATFDRACRACHDEDLVVQQRLTRDGWVREVDKMIRWGARVMPEERAPLVDFLASRWNVR